MKIKKFLAGFLSLAITSSLLPMSVSAEDTSVGYLNFSQDFENVESGTTTGFESAWSRFVGSVEEYQPDPEGDETNHAWLYAPSYTGDEKNGDFFMNMTTPEAAIDYENAFFEFGYKVHTPIFNGQYRAFSSSFFHLYLESNGKKQEISPKDSQTQHTFIIVGGIRADYNTKNEGFFQIDGKASIGRNGVVGTVTVTDVNNKKVVGTYQYTNPLTAGFLPTDLTADGTVKANMTGYSFYSTGLRYFDDIYVRQVEPTEYNVSYYLDDAGTQLYTTTAIGTNGTTIMPNNPSIRGKKFELWADENGNKFTGVNIPTEDNFKVYAKLTDEYYVNFNTLRDGITVDEIATSTGAITLPQNPTSDNGELFAGWYTKNGDEIDQATGKPTDDWGEKFNGKGIEEDITVYAKWVSIHDITFDYNYDEGPADVTLQSNIDEKIADWPADPERAGYQFLGWFTSDTEFTEGNKFENANISQTQTVYAGWAPIYTVTFDEKGGGSVDDDAPITTYTGTVTLPEPYYPGFEFGGWYKDEACTDGQEFDGTGVTGNMTVYAKWISAHKINLSLDGAEAIVNGMSVTEIYRSEYINNLPTPVKEGYYFLGWYKDSAFQNIVAEDGTDTVTEEITIYASWEKMNKITFNPLGGTTKLDDEVVEYIYVRPNHDLTPLPTAHMQGFTFVNWCTDIRLNNEFDGTGITGDMTVYAKYDNVIWYEDFEGDVSDIDWLNTITNNAAKYEREGYGVVEKGEGNHAFRFAWDSGAVVHNFPDGGDGIYELTFRVKQEKPASDLAHFMAFANTGEYASSEPGDIVADSNVNQFTPRFNGAYNQSCANMLNGKINDWIEFTYIYDSVNKQTHGKLSFVPENATQKRTYVIPTTSAGLAKSVNQIVVYQGSTGQYGITGGTGYYIDDICLKKILQPQVESMTIEGGTENVSVTPTINIEFNKTIDKTTLNNQSVVIKDSKGNTVPFSDITISTDTVDLKTVATISFKNELEMGREYTVTLNKFVTDGAYALAPSSVTFTTRPEDISATATFYSGTKEITALADNLKNKTLSFNLNLQNYQGAQSQDMFVGIALKDKKTGKMYEYTYRECNIAKGNTVTYQGSFDIPEELNSNFKIYCYIWDGKDASKRNALASEKILLEY